MNEYNVYDFLDPKARLDRADFSNHKIHKLCVTSFYLYEQEFKEKQISFNIPRSQDEVRINWSTARTALAQILDNCLKYCKPNSDIEVKISSNGAYLDLKLKMTSLYFSNSEKKSLTLPGYRGKLVPEEKIKGKGMGMYIINRMIELNEGKFDFWSNEKTCYSSGDYTYSENDFLISLKRI